MRAQRIRGFILIMSVYVLLVVSILSLSLSARSLAETMTARQYFWNDSAFSLAEASLDATMSNFRVANFNSVPSTPMGGGNYWTEVTPLPALGSDVYQIIGHGRDESVQRDLEAIVEATPFSVFQYPLFGDQLLDLRGDVSTDSYDSNAGPYDPATAGDNGDLGTNATNSDANVAGPATTGIHLAGNSVDINGQVYFGEGTTDPLQELADSTTGSADDREYDLISADPPATSLSDPLRLPPVVVPLSLTCTDLSLVTTDPLNPATLTLAPGEYCYNNLQLTGAILNSIGEVTIYITGTFQSASTTVIGNVSRPADTLFQLASTVTNAVLTGTTTLYGAIYAPESEVELHGTTEIFGSVTADVITQTGTVEFHFDEELAERDELIGGYRTEVFYWRERDLSE